jgi:hypothetical protein
MEHATQEGNKKRYVFLFDFPRGERCLRVCPFQLVKIEAEFSDLQSSKEIVDFVGVIERCGGQNGDDIEGNAILAKKVHASHDLAEGALAGP